MPLSVAAARASRLWRRAMSAQRVVSGPSGTARSGYICVSHFASAALTVASLTSVTKLQAYRRLLPSSASRTSRTLCSKAAPVAHPPPSSAPLQERSSFYTLLPSYKCDGCSPTLPYIAQALSTSHRICVAGMVTRTGRSWWCPRRPTPPRLAKLGQLSRAASR